jgi:anti-sigma factor ChrR (cupin superfamily)
MLLNDDLTTRSVIHASAMDWVASPAKGVDRRMLFRIGEEKARATSIVRYAPESRFSRHAHPGGEEFLVLEGIFQDETGDFPVGTYVRNPPGTGHTPSSDSGCTILVKLWQFKAGDRQRIIRLPGEGEPAPLRPGVSSSLTLFEGAGERVTLEEWQAGKDVSLANSRGLELLVLEGTFADGVDQFERLSWLRLPLGQNLDVRVGSHGARVWYKSAPLLHEDVCTFEVTLP